MGLGHSLTSLAPIDFVKLAAALGGVWAERVSTRAELRESVKQLLTRKGPALLQVDTPVPP